MAEYIEREAVLKIIAYNCPHDKGDYNTEEEMGAGAACHYIRKDIKKLPTADVVPKSEVEELIKSVDDMLDLVCAMTGLEITYYRKYAELKRNIWRNNNATN